MWKFTPTAASESSPDAVEDADPELLEAVEVSEFALLRVEAVVAARVDDVVAADVDVLDAAEELAVDESTIDDRGRLGSWPGNVNFGIGRPSASHWTLRPMYARVKYILRYTGGATYYQGYPGNSCNPSR